MFRGWIGVARKDWVLDSVSFAEIVKPSADIPLTSVINFLASLGEVMATGDLQNNIQRLEHALRTMRYACPLDMHGWVSLVRCALFDIFLIIFRRLPDVVWDCIGRYRYLLTEMWMLVFHFWCAACSRVHTHVLILDFMCCFCCCCCCDKTAIVWSIDWRIDAARVI